MKQMQEALEKAKAEEERLRAEEEAKLRAIEEAERKRQEKVGCLFGKQLKSLFARSKLPTKCKAKPKFGIPVSVGISIIAKD